MKLVDKRKTIVERLTMYILIVYTLSNLWGHMMGVDLNFFSRLIGTALIALGVHMILSYPFTTTIVLTFTTIPLLILNKYQGGIVSELFPWIGQFIQNLSEYFSGTEHIMSRNLTMFWVTITFCLCIVTWVVLIKIRQAWLLPVLYIPVFLYYWYIFVDTAYLMMIMFLVLYFILIGGQQYFSNERNWVQRSIKVKSDVYHNWVKTAAAYGLIIVLLAAILPKGSNVVDWYWLKDQVVEKYPAITEFRDDLVYGRSYGQAEVFTFSKTGFQQSAQLGGPVVLSDRLVMKVKAKYPFYLRGTVKSIYKNNRWEQEKIRPWSVGLNEELPTELKEGAFVELDISYVNMASYTVFAPYQPTRIVSERNGRMNYDKNYELVKISGVYKNEEYKVEAIVPRQTQPKDPAKTFVPNEEELGVYLELPEDLSPKITELANQITEGKGNPYDKAVAIKDYLRSNYKYTLEPSVTPTGKEFVEHFLFEEKQGYCTYFATSLAVMLRTQGIPTRYIEGYRMPEEHTEGVYEVRLNNAHAWVEAYIEPMGWTIFEATPAYDGPPVIRERAHTGNASEGQEQIRKPIRNPQGGEGELSGRDDLMEGIEDYGGNKNASKDKVFFSNLIDQLVAKAPKIIYILFLAGVTSRFLYTYFRTKNYYRKLQQAKSPDSIANIYRNILDILEDMGMPIETGETPFEYTERIISRVYDEEYNLRDMTNLFVKTRYSGKDIEAEELEKLLEFLLRVEKKLRVQLGFWKFSFRKYIKGEVIKYYNI